MNYRADSYNIWDLISFNIRWLVILGFTLWAPLTPVVKLILIISSLFYLLLNILLVSRKRITVLRLFGVAVDFLVSSSCFFLTGGMEGGTAWVAIFPLMTATLYFGFKGLVLSFISTIVFQCIITLSQVQLSTAMLFLLPWLFAYLLIGLGLFLLIQRLHQAVTHHPDQEIDPTQPKEVESERRKAFYQLITTLSATLDYQRVLETALDMSVKALPSPDHAEEKLVSAVLMIQKKPDNTLQLHVESSRRLTPNDNRLILEGSKGILLEALENTKPILFQKPASDPELSRMIALRSCESVYCIPLRKNLDVYGVLLFAHPDQQFFTEEKLEILQIIANQAMVAIENARLYHQLEEEKERIMEIQEDARKKLARDLHDGPTQSVSALAMRVNYARRLLERNQPEAIDELFKIEELARRTTKEIRHMLFTLRPLVLESEGLIAALHSMAEKMKETYNQQVIIQADAHIIESLEMGKQSVIFAIAEEAVNNARKHAEADHIWVRLGFSEHDIILLEIQDDGNGFDPYEISEGYESRGSLGIVNMRERAQLVNGLFRIESKPGKGTRVRVWVPLNEHAQERLHNVS